MEFHLLQLVLATLTLVVMASHAASPPELYWNSVLPNTQMPKAIRVLLNPTGNENFATRINTYKIMMEHVTGIDTDKIKTGYGRFGRIKTGYTTGSTWTKSRQGMVDLAGSRQGNTIGSDLRPIKTGYGGCGCIQTGYTTGIDTDKIKTQFDPNFALFFLEKDLYVGKTMNLDFSPFRNKATFLPRQIADSTPFSSNKLPEIYSMFAVKPKSKEAEALEETIKSCEKAADEGEEKYCAASLESMIEFVSTKLGKSVRPMATEMSTTTVQYQKYRVAAGVKKVTNKKAVVCHKEDYPYAVFYCHTLPNTEIYAIPLVAADGTKVNAAAVCHVDTASWNPKHLAFEILQVKPGTASVCHFLEQFNFVWVRN